MFSNRARAAALIFLSACHAVAATETSRPFDLRPPLPEAKYLQTEPAAEGGSSSEGELAKKLSNPISSLISVPFQSNFDFNAGQDNDKFKYTLNVQPVIPISLNQDWNLIARVI